MAAQPPVCSICRTPAADPLPLSWSTASGQEGLLLFCERCTREHLRSIEGKLDEAWW